MVAYIPGAVAFWELFFLLGLFLDHAVDRGHFPTNDTVEC